MWLENKILKNEKYCMEHIPILFRGMHLISSDCVAEYLATPK
jgi:hypothetical protein